MKVDVPGNQIAEVGEVLAIGLSGGTSTNTYVKMKEKKLV